MPDGTGERYYFVRPGQRLRREKFLSKNLKGAKNHMTFKICRRFPRNLGCKNYAIEQERDEVF